MKIVVGISGATGVIYGVRTLEALHLCNVETHLVMSGSAKRTIELESDFSVKSVEALADYVHDIDNIAASISSGSFKTNGMIIVPCSMKTLSAVAHSYNENLLIRAADVTLKEGRKLVLVTRETPLHLGHLRLMTAVAEVGATILPPMPAFYHKPESIEDIVNQTVGKILDQLQIENKLFERWKGDGGEQENRKPLLAVNSKKREG